MSPDKFADRLAPETYQDDDRWVGVFENDPSAEDSLWLSARLFARLGAIAAGYDLHTLPRLGGVDPVQLNGLRCESLIDQLAFVAERSSSRSYRFPAMIRIRRLPKQRFRRVSYEIEYQPIHPADGFRLISRHPVLELEQIVGVGDGWAMIHAADQAWDGHEGQWVTIHSPCEEP